MTSQEIRRELEAIKMEAARCAELHKPDLGVKYLAEIPFWEIAYQLAVQNERNEDGFAVTRIMEKFGLADPQQPKRDADSERGEFNRGYELGRRDALLTADKPLNRWPLVIGYRCMRCNYDRVFEDLKPLGRRDLAKGICPACKQDGAISIVFGPEERHQQGAQPSEPVPAESSQTKSNEAWRRGRTPFDQDERETGV